MIGEINEYRLGQQIPITRVGKIVILDQRENTEEYEIQFPLSSRRIAYLGLWISVFFFTFTVFVVNIIALIIVLITHMDLSMEMQPLSNIVELHWRYKNNASEFQAERQTKIAEGQWRTYSALGPATVEKDSYMLVDDEIEPNTIYRYKLSMDFKPLGWFHVFVLPFLKSKTTLSSEVLTLPSKPEVVSAASPSDRQVVLRWQQPFGAERFGISRGENQADLKLLEISQDQIRQENRQHVYADQGLTPNKKYWYALVAWNRSGPSERADPVCTLTLPSPPTDLKIEDASGGVRLNWLYSDNVSGFRLEASRTDSDYRIVRNNIPPDARSFADTISEDKQWYRIIAYNESGDSQPATLPPQLIVKSVQPRHGAPGGNTRITINGTGFVTEGLKVRIGGNDARVEFVTSLSITAFTPRGEGIRDVLVETDYGKFTLPKGFAYAYGLVEIPPAGVLPRNAEMEITVDEVQYSLGKEQQEAPWTRTSPTIHIGNGRGHEFKPLEENPDFYAGELKKLYLCYIELRKPFPENSKVYIHKHNSDVAITIPYHASKSPIILLLRNSSELVDVEVKKDREGGWLDGIYGFEISLNRPLRKEDWK